MTRYIELRSDSPHRAQVFVDGQHFGVASDCDLGRWIIVSNINADSDDPDAWDELDGCYPARTVQGLGYAITQCCANVGTVLVDGEAVQS